MKSTAAQFAKILYEITKDKSRTEIDGVMVGFVQMLKKNGQLRLKQDIINGFINIYNRENGIIEADVISRERLNNQLADKLFGFIKNKYSAKEVVINNRIDESIKGGVIVKVGDEVMDGSVDRKLKILRSSLAK